jgi:hypothetical protein
MRKKKQIKPKKTPGLGRRALLDAKRSV